MRAHAVVLGDFHESLQLVERDVPEACAGAIVAEVLYAGVCGTDVHLHAGRMDIPTPLVLGHEAVGRVARLGEDVHEDALGQPLREGDAIGWASSIPCGGCMACRSDAVTLCERRRVYGINLAWREWPHFTGGWATAIYLQPGTTVLRLPDGVEPLDVIALGCAGPTSVHGFDQIGDVAGRTVLVQGAGPVGIASALIARQRGARQVALIGGPSARIVRVEGLKVVDACIDMDSEPDPSRRAAIARRLIGDERGADVVVECTGSPAAVGEGIDLCRPGGRYLVLGQYTDRGATPINPHHITRKQLTVAGSWGFSPRDYLEYLRLLPDLLRVSDLQQLVDVFSLSDADRALDSVRSGRTLKAAFAPADRGETPVEQGE